MHSDCSARMRLKVVHAARVHLRVSFTGSAGIENGAPSARSRLLSTWSAPPLEINFADYRVFELSKKQCLPT
jgi:hypothetical protein